MGVAFQGTFALFQLAALALLARAFDEARFGILLTIYAMSMWLTLGNMGVHNAMLTWVGRDAFRNPRRAATVLRGATQTVLAFGVILGAAFLCFGPFLPWGPLFDLTDPTEISQARNAAMAAMVFAALFLPLLTGGVALQAHQRGDLRHLAGIMGHMVVLLLLFCALQWEASLAVMAVLLCSGVYASGVLQWWFGIRGRLFSNTAPRASMKRVRRALLRMGVGFLLLDMFLVTVLQGGPVILSQLHGPEAVVPYGATQRIAGLLIASCMMIGQAFWPAFGDAHAHSDTEWIRRTLTSLFLATIVVGVPAVVIIFFAGGPFVRVWLGSAAVPTQATLLWAGVFAVVLSFSFWIGAALSGLRRIRIQMWASQAGLMVFLILSVILGHRYGPAGVFSAQLFAACTWLGVAAFGFSPRKSAGKVGRTSTGSGPVPI